MKKEVSYYLEDTSRLEEISQSDLDAWIAEMPFHQPLQMLAGIKSEMAGTDIRKGRKVYATYFAEDYEVVLKGKTQNNNQRNKNTIQLSTTIDIQPKNVPLEEMEEIDEDVKIKLPEVIHDLADDTLEDEIEKEVLEEFGKIESMEEISINLMNDAIEKEDNIVEIENESIEVESASIPEEEPSVSTVEALEEMSKEEVEEVSEVFIKEEIEVVALDAEINDPMGLTSTESAKDIFKVDYSDYTNIVSNLKKVQGIRIPDSDKTEPLDADASIEDVKKDSKEKKKKADNAPALVRKKITATDNTKKKKNTSEKKKEPKKKKDGQTKEALSEKNIENIAVNPEIIDKRKKVKVNKKVKAKKRDKKVKYIIVDSTKNEKFKLNDYGGVSNYTSWLLEQESINGKNEHNENAQHEPKKSKKKKKDKKSKSLKIAIDSIKNQESIISEPLANILALQGHNKKAIKMYSKLAFVFPEKKEYFKEKIESLKN